METACEGGDGMRGWRQHVRVEAACEGGDGMRGWRHAAMLQRSEEPDSSRSGDERINRLQSFVVRFCTNARRMAAVAASPTVHRCIPHNALLHGQTAGLPIMHRCTDRQQVYP